MPGRGHTRLCRTSVLPPIRALGEVFRAPEAHQMMGLVEPDTLVCLSHLDSTWVFCFCLYIFEFSNKSQIRKTQSCIQTVAFWVLFGILDLLWFWKCSNKIETLKT
jgi:hypothetical protein